MSWPYRGVAVSYWKSSISGDKNNILCEEENMQNIAGYYLVYTSARIAVYWLYQYNC